MAGLQLANYLREQGTPFVWGESDCCLFASGWVVAYRGVDPMADWRGRYRSALGAKRLVDELGGLVPAAKELMAAKGFEETDETVPGDVAIVKGDRLALAIRTQRGFAFKTPSGVRVAPMEPLVAWRI